MLKLREYWGCKLASRKESLVTTIKELGQNQEKSKKSQHEPSYSSVKFHRKYWNSRLFNESYILNDLENKHKEIWHTDSQEFNQFYQRLINLFEDFRAEENHINKWSETETISNWVRHVLDALGWDNNSHGKRTPYLEETSFTRNGKTLRTDILIVDNPDEKRVIKDKKGDDRIREAINTVLIPVEVKYWNRLKQDQDEQIMDKSRVEKKQQDEFSTTVSPNEQTIRYMNLIQRPWGILTDGAVWRLFHKDLSSDPSRYYEFNLQTLFRQYLTGESEADRTECMEAAKYLYFFFSKESLDPQTARQQPFCDELLEYSKKYIYGVQEDLKGRFIEAMNICCNAYFKMSQLEVNEENLKFIRNISESTLFNILFTKSLESRGILQLSDKPYFSVSLSNIIDCIGGTSPRLQYDPELPKLTNKKRLNTSFENSGKHKFAYTPEDVDIHQKVFRLTRIIHDGGSKFNDFGFEIKGFKESIFDKKEFDFFKKFELPNQTWVEIIFQLAFIDSDTRGTFKYKQIPYAYFSPRELGEIYEGFLEFRLSYAKKDMVFEKKQWKPADLKSNKYRNSKYPKANKGTLFFSPNNKDRRDTGSYYTPDYIVQYIVKETLGPLCKNKSTKKIESIKVCDGAMGSGHFLVASLNFLKDEYMKALYKESSGDVKKTPAEIKRHLLDKCIFGVDINSRAVKLAKMSLWLESAHTKAKLERLDDQLICDNLLVNQFPWKEYGKLKFSAFVQNPPYIGEKGNKELFKPIKEGWLGEFYLGKMDYFYFFIHAAFNLLEDNGRIGVITTNYFPTALGALKLRKDIENRSSNIRFIQLNDNKVFRSASGQHNIITFLEKGNGPSPISFLDIKTNKNFGKEYFNNSFKKSKFSSGKFEREERYIRLSSKEGASNNAIPNILEVVSDSDYLLGEIAEINTGIQTGADKLSKSHIEKYSIKGEKGEGIFVLSKDEIKSKGIELEYLRPFFKNSDIEKFNVKSKSSRHILYLDKSVNMVDNYVERHLLKFQSILNKRREVENGRIRWFNLQWPRERLIFESPKIVAPQRSNKNTFGYNEISWYAATDVFFITNKVDSNMNLKTLCGLLNSKLYYCWLYFKGKRKGENLELIRKPLSEIPIPKINEHLSKKIKAEVEILIKENTNSTAFKKLNKYVYEMFGLNKDQILEVENFITRNFQPNQIKFVKMWLKWEH